MGLFWKKTSTKGAIIGVLSSIPVALALKFLPIDMPFLDQMLVAFFMISLVIVSISLLDKQKGKGLDISRQIFRTDKLFNILSIIIIVILSSIYILLW